MSSKAWKEKNREHIKAHAREYYHKNKERILAQKKDPAFKEKDRLNKIRYREAHKEEIALRDQTPARRMSTAKSMAKKRGHTWNLTLEQYKEIIIEPCYYCCNKLGEPVKKGSGLDRKNSDLGYEIDNVVSCCNFCNGLKSDKLTPEECKAAVKAVLEIRENK